MINQKINKLFCLLLNKSLIDLYNNLLPVEFVNDEDGVFLTCFLKDKVISSNDFGKIKKQIQKNIDRNYSITYKNIKLSEAKEIFKNNKYKLDFLNSLKSENVGVAIIGDNEYIDFCEDLKLSKFNVIKAFELFNVSGSYWKANANNEQLTAITAVAFESKNELEEFIKILNERKERDHRKIGKDLELFTFDKNIGQGLPIWLHNGTVIKREIEKFIFDLLFQYDFNIVSTPVLGTKQLYETSGHWNHYRENMFPAIKVDEETFVLRPMTCPHHLTVYKTKKHSYKELPFRIGELAILHRYEASGGLIGLERVRQMYLIDTHVLVTPEQITSEIKRCYSIIKTALETFGIHIHSVSLSLHDPKDKEKFFDDKQMWANSEKQLQSALDELNIKYEKMVGDAAFYGPKIDFQAKTVLGKIITVSTIQLDFLLPNRFELKYHAKDGTEMTPVLVHLGSIGTLERFISILLEQTKGILPLWLAPNQVQLILVNDSLKEYGDEIYNGLKKNNIRVWYDLSEERLSKKIRNGQIKKVPYQLIIGENEKQKKTVSFRKYGSQDSKEISLQEFVSLLKDQILSKK